MPDDARLPLWSRFLLWPFKGEPSFPQVVGDLTEELWQRTAEDGSSLAHRWLHREVWRTFWALVWRRETGYVLATSLFSFALIMMTRLTVVLLSADGSGSYASWATRIWLETTLLGLAAGAVAGRLNGDHARLGRLILVATVGLPPLVAGLVYWTQYQAYWTMVLLSTVSLRRLTFLASIWLGSLWMERRNRRLAARAAG